MKEVENKKDVDLKATDNIYHTTIRSGKKSKTNKYSDSCVELLIKVRDGIEYELDVNIKRD